MWSKSWMLTQIWQDVLFLHWPVSPKDLEQYIPQELQLDLYENNAWLSVVLFKVKGQRLRYLPPLPGVGSHLQLNVRTYVTYNGMKGIYFFNLDVTNRFIVQIATKGSLSYRHSKIALNQTGNNFSFTSLYHGALDERLKISYQPTASEIITSTFDKWLVERYHSWSKWKSSLVRIDIDHMPWQLQRVHINIESNTLAPFVKESIQGIQPIAHYSKSKEARIYSPKIETGFKNA
ncbi:YqjF family protein [Lysinibacillus sp. NPDC092081]|uniref:YqjF family protein n=1 Tax=Lysinibacillus sp. NPDC092081 TaxID=3364131 RepID=UPI003809A198